MVGYRPRWKIRPGLMDEIASGAPPGPAACTWSGDDGVGEVPLANPGELRAGEFRERVAAFESSSVELTKPRRPIALSPGNGPLDAAEPGDAGVPTWMAIPGAVGAHGAVAAPTFRTKSSRLQREAAAKHR
jgi:hypothetical protein